MRYTENTLHIGLFGKLNVEIVNIFTTDLNLEIDAVQNKKQSCEL